MVNFTLILIYLQKGGGWDSLLGTKFTYAQPLIDFFIGVEICY